MIRIQWTTRESSVAFSLTNDEITIYVNTDENKHDAITKAFKVIADHKRNMAQRMNDISIVV